MKVMSDRAFPRLDRRRTVIGAWLAAATLLPFARGVEKRLDTGTRVPNSESARVAELLATSVASPYARYAVLVVRGLPLAAERRDRALLEITRELETNRAVATTRSVLDVPDSVFIGADGTTFLIAGLTDSVISVDSLLPTLRVMSTDLQRKLRATYPSVELFWTGELPLTVDLRRVAADNARRSERRVLPLTLALLVFAFGAIVAAALPVAFGALSIAMTMGCVALIARFFPMSILVLNVVTMLGLGLGIDYALLLVSRFREARAAGVMPNDAAAIAARHAGRSILLSGAAVILGFAALLLAPLTDLRSIAIGGALVTLVSMLLATTLLPPVLAMLGARVELLRVRRARATSDRSNLFWRAWSSAVVRRPVVVLLIAGAPVAALAWQWLGLVTRTPSVEWLPASIESARGLHALQRIGRSGIVQSVRVVLELPPDVAASEIERVAAVGALAARLRADPRVARVVPGAMSADGRLVLLEVMPVASGGDGLASAMELVRDIRTLNADSAIGVRGARLLVGGLPAFNADYGDAIKRATPRVVALVVLGTFIALVIGFRSIVIPLKAVALNLVSVAAAFGAVVLVFQHGVGIRLFGLSAPLDAIFPAVPLLVFCTVFGLSMDYEVFLVSRVAEAKRAGADDNTAVVEGVVATGHVITSAAAVMVVVFAAFTTGEFVLMKILGFALAVAVLIDATLIRLALGPALLRLAGRWNWWPGQRSNVAVLFPIVSTSRVRP
jgi:RND superfamily putative drug exporter